MKACEGNARIKQYTDNGVTCWTGNDDECYDAHTKPGGRCHRHLNPSRASQMLFDGPNPELRDRLAPLMGWLFAEPNPTGINTACAMLGVAACLPSSLRPVRRGARARRRPPRRVARPVVGDGVLHSLDDTDFTILRDW